MLADIPKVTVTAPPPISRHKKAVAQIRDMLNNVATYADPPGLEPLEAALGAVEASGDLDAANDAFDTYYADWNRLVDDVAAELAPQVARLLEAAIARRLPWSNHADR